MARIASLFRYPLKGFSPEKAEAFDLEAGRFVPGDRVFALENGPSGFDPDAPGFIPKSRFWVLAAAPGIARIKTRYDPAGERLLLRHGGGRPRAFDLNRPQGRAELAGTLCGWLDPDALRGPVRLLSHPDHRFTDDKEGQVSAINLASVEDLSRRMGQPLDPVRFRANIYLDGLSPWEELDWREGQALCIDGLRLEVFKPIVRCLATHVDPATGERDAEVVPSLYRHFGHRLCGLYLRTTRGGRLLAGADAELC